MVLVLEVLLVLVFLADAVAVALLKRKYRRATQPPRGRARSVIGVVVEHPFRSSDDVRGILLEEQRD